MNDGELRSLRAGRVYEASLTFRIIVIIADTPLWNQCSGIIGVCVLVKESSADHLLLNRDCLM